MTEPRRNLVIAAVGNSSQHNSWLPDSSARTFDLALIYYGDQSGTFRSGADIYVERKGFKFPLIADLCDELGQVLDNYDFVWLPDDDIATITADINRLFEIARQYQLPIAQPAIATGDVSYQSMRVQPNLLLRYTRFAEVMCPVFSRAALASARPTFRETVSGWGIDWAWTRLVDCRQIAVVDAVGVHHTRPLATGDAYRRFAQQGVSPSEERRRIMRCYGLRGPATRIRQRQLKYGTALCEAIDLAGQRSTVGPPWYNRLSRAG
jgi:hypothetical protein